MIDFEFKEEEIITVDIHKMEKWEAKYYLERLLVSVSPEIREIVVIHGYNRGTTLLEMVRKEIKSRKIRRRFLSLNKGVTSLILS